MNKETASSGGEEYDKKPPDKEPPVAVTPQGKLNEQQEYNTDNKFGKYTRVYAEKKPTDKYYNNLLMEEKQDYVDKMKKYLQKIGGDVTINSDMSFSVKLNNGYLSSLPRQEQNKTVYNLLWKKIGNYLDEKQYTYVHVVGKKDVDGSEDDEEDSFHIPKKTKSSQNLQVQKKYGKGQLKEDDSSQSSSYNDDESLSEPEGRFSPDAVSEKKVGWGHYVKGFNPGGDKSNLYISYDNETGTV